ncbi:hypothetical protein C2E21_3663 [Chlorella sorokiniana]|uniref:Uncharacterized protein n=1 Tax=Chlorella sorokiniana TaxID=3076 RepID=A0A2P6TVG0_CHLSO|nr:hypothetical protein C2E21_3663 [Chlorella sorokiniana]|eukprot:PRW58044.1 hypothetical protein C2E21_3663 [Chlorella sorokiniana]
MTEASAAKPPARGRLGAVFAALLGCTALLALLGSGAWEAREFKMPTLRAYRFAALGRGHRWAGGGSSEPAATASPPPVCELDVEQGPIAESCHLVTDVCVDQQMAVLYGSEYHPPPGATRAPAELPLLEPSHRHSHYVLSHRDTGAREYRYPLPPLQFRASSTDEALPYLAEPVFSSCTVPVVYYSHYLVNPAHMFRDNAAVMYGALNESSWGEHAKLVVMTAMGLSPPRFAAQVMEAVTPHMAVETWAQFSSRLPSQPAPCGGYLPAPAVPQQPGSPRASWEGGPQRCFKHMFVCTNGVNSTETWPLHAFGRHLAKHHLGSLPPEAQSALQAQPPVALQRRLRMVAEADERGSSNGGGSSMKCRRCSPAGPGMEEGGSTDTSDDGGSSGSRSSGGRNSEDGSSSKAEPAVLNILFHRRGVDRLLLNAAELLERCNAWNYTTAAGVQVRARCSEVELTDLFAGIVAAQRADIFIGAHGANMANGWLMRPGSSVLELTMHQFEEGAAHAQYPKRNTFDIDTQVQYWKVLLCDERRYPPGSWSPGPKEEEDRAAGKIWHPLWPKFRNLAVRWEVIDIALREIVEAGGDMEEYRQRWDEGRWWWLSAANQTVYAGPEMHQTCRRARAFGLIS